MLNDRVLAVVALQAFHCKYRQFAAFGSSQNLKIHNNPLFSIQVQTSGTSGQVTNNRTIIMSSSSSEEFKPTDDEAQVELTEKEAENKNVEKKKKKKDIYKATREIARQISAKDDLTLIEKETDAQDETRQKTEEDLIKEEEERRRRFDHETSFRRALILLFVMQVTIIILFGVCAEEKYVGEDFGKVYQMFTGIEIMMFFGFGYLMTFLKRYGMGAVGFTMLITVIGIQWGVLVEAFFAMSYENGENDESFHYVEVNIIKLMDALFLVAAVLISYGAIIGKVNPLQLVIMTLFEAIFYSINKACLLLGVVSLVDAGGTINIHMFGCYFGLAVSYIIGKPPATEDSEGGHIADLFSLIGTIFLWVYWPSFNGGALEPDSEPQQRAIVNTILALSACTVTTFWVSCILSADWKFRPVDLQNATLAGGVAIGAVCHMTLNTADSLLLGASAGLFSTLGFARIQGYLENWGLHDTCGVNNLHGIPSLIGGLASVILAAYKGPKGHDYPEVIPHQNQWQGNLFSILFTLGVSVVSGLSTGYLMKQFSYETTFYSDEPYWEVMDDFGRSHEDTMRKHLTDLEAGLEASRSLRDIIAKYSTLGFASGMGFGDLSTHSKSSQKSSTSKASSN